MARPNWRDSRLLNWRLAEHLCIRWMPGPWVPDIWWRRDKRYFAITLPVLFGITIDYS